MFFGSILQVGLLASAAVAHAVLPSSRRVTRATHSICGTRAPSTKQLEATQEVVDLESAARVAGNLTRRAVVVDTYFHVVATSTRPADGYLTDAQLQQQLAVLNADFASSGFSFRLLGTDRTVNTNWANDRAELTMKRALRKGDYGTLNVYFQTAASGYLGYCYFPESTTTGSTTFYTDGCTILADTAPGGPEEHFNLGRTATHEIGHWLGLYHTFEGGCSGSGDFISDTPPEASEAYECPVGRDTCSGGGVDPIRNFMDYTWDDCMNQFTAGQATRMNSYWTRYRA